MLAKTFQCSSCDGDKERVEFHEERRNDRSREVTSQCRLCRSESYYSRRYPDVCQQCLKHRPLDKNQICSGCNAENGLRQCRVCNELLLYLMEFYGNRKTCKACRRSLRNG